MNIFSNNKNAIDQKIFNSLTLNNNELNNVIEINNDDSKVKYSKKKNNTEIIKYKYKKKNENENEKKKKNSEIIMILN